MCQRLAVPLVHSWDIAATVVELGDDVNVDIQLAVHTTWQRGLQGGEIVEGHCLQQWSAAGVYTWLMDYNTKPLSL
jgi:hypothetical protein